MRYEVEHDGRITPANTYREAVKIYNRSKLGKGFVRLYCISEGQRNLMRVKSRRIERA